MKNITLILIALSFQLNAFAQWTTDTDVNTLVVESESGDLKAIGTSDGQTYVVFWKNVGAPTNFELRLQLLSASGERQLGDDGILLGANLPMSTWTAIMILAIDDQDNLYVGATGTEDFSSHAYKVNQSGTLLWGDEGITLGEGAMVTILPLQSGEAIVTWNAGTEINMQKFDTDGNDVWGEIKTVTLSSGNTSPGNLFELSNGDYIMIIHSYNFGISSTVYAQRFNPDGEPQWASAVQLSNTGTVFNTEYTGTQDVDTVYFGYMGSHSNRFDSYLQRINPDGTLPWGINGADFDVNETDLEMDTRIAYSPGSQYVWSICTYKNSNQSESGEYIQKFDKKTGARQLTDNAKMIYAIGGEKVHASDLHLNNSHPLFLLKIGFDNGATPTTLNALLLDENGDFIWPEEYKPMATFEASKGRIHLTKPVNNQSVAVFVEDKGTGQKIYAQNIIEALPLPAQPVLATPENEVIDVPILEVFTWEQSEGAETYNIQISEDDAFNNIIVDEFDLMDTTYEFLLPDGLTTYYWRVNASNVSGAGEWSETWSFTTENVSGVNEISSAYQLKTYPNPAKDLLFIDFISPVGTDVQLSVYNLMGSVQVYLTDNISVGNNKIQVDVSDLPMGSYFYRITGKDLILYGRFSTVK